MTVLYISGALIVWVALYGFRFRWYDTAAGQLVFWFTLSLLGVVALIFVAIFVGGSAPWYVSPPDVLEWRPAFRFAVYFGVAVTITRLDASLVARLRRRSQVIFDVEPRKSRHPAE